MGFSSAWLFNYSKILDYNSSNVNNERHEFQMVAFPPSERDINHTEKPSGYTESIQKCYLQKG